jgi:surface antigen
MNPIRTRRLSRTRYIAAAGIIAYVFAFMVGVATADQYSAQINQLNAQNNQIKQQNQSLANEAASYEETINNLAAQIRALEAQIRANQVRQVELQSQITHQKSVLGQNIRAMYLEGEISTFEVLASSNDLSEAVDKEQYRNEVKDKVSQTLEKINQLKKQLEVVIAEQKASQTQLDGQRAEQAKLLAYNEAQRASLNAQLKNNNSQISDLRRQQAAANARLFGNGVRNVSDTSGYPWSGVSFPNTIADPWGMYKRQCVSYTAWKVANSGRFMPYWGGRGNANQWDDNARAAGIPVDGNPRVGDVAVSNSGYYGHVMYVEAVYGDGTIYVSQYNAGWSGSYSEARISASGLVFIHF